MNKVIWFTGLSGSGKTTIANRLQVSLSKNGITPLMLDGDILRKGLNSDLNFSSDHRKENIRRTAHIAALASQSGILTLCSLITPSADDRFMATHIVGSPNIVWVYIKCSLETCEKRDVKGLYKKARNGEIIDFTGIGSSYEVPENPHVILDSEQDNLDSCMVQLQSYLKHIA